MCFGCGFVIVVSMLCLCVGCCVCGDWLLLLWLFGFVSFCSGVIWFVLVLFGVLCLLFWVWGV